MNTRDDNDPLARRARDVFAAASDGLDPAMANRLRLARRAALAGPPARRFALAPVAGAIALALAALWAWPRMHATGPATLATAPAHPVAVPPPSAPQPAPAPRQPEAAVASDGPVVAVAPDEPEAGPLDDELADDDLALTGDDEDAELVDWLAEAPVAPDDGAGAL